MSTLIAILFIAPLLLLLGVIIRFSIISPAITKGAKNRLRHPEPEKVESICGFLPPQDLVQLYQKSRMIELVEFYLIDRSKYPTKAWCIGEFYPLTAIDIREQKIIIGLKEGIPIADDMNKGAYFLTRDGSIKLLSPNVKNGEIQVAKSVREFANFEIHDEPPVDSDIEPDQ